MWSEWQTLKRARHAAGFLGGLLVPLLLAAGPAAGAFVEPINLSNSLSTTSTRPAIAVNGAGQVFVVWREGTDILFSRSQPTPGSCTGPGALKFETPVNLSAGTGTASVAAVAANDTGGVFVAWQAVQLPASSEIWFRRSLDGGQSFLPAVNLSQNTGPSNFPSVAADTVGGVFVAWGDGSPPAMASQHEILFRRSLTFGADFEPAANLSQTPATNSRVASVATDGSNVFLAWQDGSSFLSLQLSKILYKKFGRLDNLTAVAGSAAVDLSAGLGNAFTPDLAFGGGRLSLAFVTSNGPSVYHRWSIDGTGTTFSAPENLSGAVVAPNDPRAARRNDNAMVAWSQMLDPMTGNTEIRYRLPGTMAGPETVWATPSRSVAPAVAIDPTGRLLVGWQETSSGAEEIYLSYSGGTGGGTMMEAKVWAAPRVLKLRDHEREDGERHHGRGHGEQPKFTVFIELPGGLARDIDPTTVKLNGQPALLGPSTRDEDGELDDDDDWAELEDENDNGIPELEVKFNRSVFDLAGLTDAQRNGNFTVTGSTRSGGCFSGSGVVQIRR